MSSEYRISNSGGTYYLTTTIVNWVDVFTRKRYRDIVLESLTHCIQHKQLHLHGWVLMPNHLHWIASTVDEINLSTIIRDFKKHTSKRIIESISAESGESRKEWMLRLFAFAGKRNVSNTNYQLWQNGNHAVSLFSNDVVKQKLDYLHNNPVRAGWVLRPEEYLYSSAIDYLGGKGLINIEPIILKEFVR